MEELIIQQLKQGREEAYRYLYECHYALLCHVAQGYVNDKFLAETLVSDVFFHLWEIHKELNIQTSLRNYLIRAVRNHRIDFLNLKQEQTEVPFSALGDETPFQDRYVIDENYPLGMLLEKELEKEIMQTLAQLPEECRKVFLKSRFEKKTYKEIADDLCISVNTVKYHIKNALAFLYSRLGHYLPGIFSLFFLR